MNRDEVLVVHVPGINKRIHWKYSFSASIHPVLRRSEVDYLGRKHSLPVNYSSASGWLRYKRVHRLPLLVLPRYTST